MINEASNINNSIKTSETTPNADADAPPEVPEASRSNRSAHTPSDQGECP